MKTLKWIGYGILVFIDTVFSLWLDFLAVLFFLAMVTGQLFSQGNWFLWIYATLIMVWRIGGKLIYNCFDDLSVMGGFKVEKTITYNGEDIFDGN